jgi:hypothetical protein
MRKWEHEAKLMLQQQIPIKTLLPDSRFCFTSVHTPHHFSPLAAQLLFALLPVRERPSQYPPKLWGVVMLEKMNQFVDYNIIHQSHRQLKEPPIEVKAAILSARTPTVT